MPMVEMPKSRYLQVADMKNLPTEKRKCVIKIAPTEGKTNPEMLSVIVDNEALGEKEIYDYKNKFREFFESFTCNTDEWVGKSFNPILPTGNSIFFSGYEIITHTEEDIA